MISRALRLIFDDILVLGKDGFENHIEKLIIIFGRMRAAGLKVNAPKCSLGLKEIPYLGYVITRGLLNLTRIKCKVSWILGDHPKQLKRDSS